jgi:ATP-dependent protease HslVU (ClpYQ) peptidase subunit
MTTIVAIQGDDFAVVGYDSRISSMDNSGYVSQVFTLGESSAKVATNGKYILGAAGDVRAINILHHVFAPPPPALNLRGSKLDKFFTNTFIPSLRECFEKQGYASPDTEDKQHIAEQGSTIMVVVNATVYVVDSDYSWASDLSGIYALGSGAPYALGALHMNKTLSVNKNKALGVHTAKTLVLKALSVSSKFDPHTGSPFKTITQDFTK